MSPFLAQKDAVANEDYRFEFTLVEIGRAQWHDETAEADDRRRFFGEYAADDVMLQFALHSNVLE